MSVPTPLHVPVLSAEILSWLRPAPGMILVDGTMGGGGHTRLLAERLEPGGYVIATERDPAAVEAAEKNLAGLPVKLAHSSYSDLPDVLAEIGIQGVDGILLDLGLSSDQLADEQRGFSFDSDGPLDMRFDPTAGEPAWRMLGRLREEELADIIFEYGEERFSRRIARKIVERRKDSPIQTASELATLVRRCVPHSGADRIDAATRTFQALRIAVNAELDIISTALKRLPDCLRPGGRLAIISFHSLEDRLVKNAFRDDPRLEVLTKKPVMASEEEMFQNPRSRSAKLRVAECRRNS